VSWTNTEWEVHLWAAGETGATEAARSVAPAEGVDPEPEPGAGTRRDTRTREAPEEEAARTKRDTGRGSTSASTGWQNAWSDSKKKCASCAAATAGAPEALKVTKDGGIEALALLLALFSQRRVSSVARTSC
jgi:hypothetical protein